MWQIILAVRNFYRGVLPPALDKSMLTFSQTIVLGIAYLFLFSLLLIFSDLLKGDLQFGFWFLPAGLRFIFLLIFGWRFSLLAPFAELLAWPLSGKWEVLYNAPLWTILSIIVLPIIYVIVIDTLKKLKLLNVSFAEFSDFAWLCAAIVVAPAIAAIGSTLLVQGTILVSQDEFMMNITTFWLGDMIGILLVVPLAISLLLGGFGRESTNNSLIQPMAQTLSRKYFFEFVLSFFIGLVLILFTNFLFGNVRWLPFLLPTSWLAIRYGFGGASIAVSALIISLGVLATFIDDTTMQLGISFFLPIMSIMIILLGALSSSRKVLQLQLEQQLMQIAHQDRLNSLGEMASILAHELVQPLSGIKVSLARIRKLLPAENSNETLPALTESENATDRMVKIIAKVREFAKRGKLQKQQTTFAELISEIEPLINLEARKVKLEIKYRLENERRQLYVDVVQVQQCILNLVRNAVTSIGLVERNNHELIIACKETEDKFVIAVSDTGVGIKKEMKDKLFNPYESSSTSNIGLGLSICQTIIEEHSGQIYFRNNDDVGTTFFLKLPLKEFGRGK